MKKLILALALMFGAAAQAEDIVLVSRNGYGTYETTATYSFRKMTHDVNLTRNNWDILFEAREDLEDYFETNMVTDDRGRILDLGKNCQVEQNFIAKILNQSSRAKVVEGHCYVVVADDSDGTVLAQFKVAKHLKSVAVVLTDVSVFYQTSIR